MEVKQVAELVNLTTKEVLGEEVIVKEDLSNVVDLGEAVFNANAVDKYVKSLVNHIGKVIFVNRAYKGKLPSVLMNAWEFGSVLEKVSASMPIADENESWELEDGAVYEENQFYKPKVTAKFFNKMVTFEVPYSITEMQVKQSFSSAQQLNGFVSMLYTAVENSMTIKVETLIERLVNTAIVETLNDEYPEKDYSSKTTTKAVNLLKEYNDKNGTTLTKDKALFDLDFLKYASYRIGVTLDRLTKMSTLFNVGETEKFTPKDDVNLVLLSDFAKASDTYLQADTYHNELTKLPNYETTPYWQGTGKTYSFNDISKINVKVDDVEVELDGILGVAFDRNAIAVCNENKRVKTKYINKAEFYNNWYKMDCRYICDLNENIVVFFIA